MTTTTRPPRPVALRVRIDGIPGEMKGERRWIGWRYWWNGKKWTKPLFMATNPAQHASSTDPTTWSSFAETIAAYEQGAFDGIGFVLGDGWVGFDADEIDATEYINILKTYSERSPGNNGVHAIAHGMKPSNDRCKTEHYELYDHDRYFTVTGHHLEGTPLTVEKRTPEIAIVYERIFPPDDDAPPNPSVGHDVPKDDDVLIAEIRASKHGEKFNALWAGKWQGLYDSESQADLGLCNIFAFWTRDAAQMNRLFRRSGLMDKKWDRKLKGSTCGAVTIAKAIKAQGFHQAKEKGIFADRLDPATVDLVWERLVEHNHPPTLFRRQRKIVMPVAEGITSNFSHLFATPTEIAD
jgi:primase-polymerase (primpol)-like protein